LRLFEQAFALWPAEGPARTLAERCAIYRKTATPVDWDGVFEQAFKK